ncbi:hypothetical protein GQ457_17G005120 [Hibiscus cannabinus]
MGGTIFSRDEHPPWNRTRTLAISNFSLDGEGRDEVGGRFSFVEPHRRTYSAATMMFIHLLSQPRHLLLFLAESHSLGSNILTLAKCVHSQVAVPKGSQRLIEPMAYAALVFETFDSYELILQCSRAKRFSTPNRAHGQCILMLLPCMFMIITTTLFRMRMTKRLQNVWNFILSMMK